MAAGGRDWTLAELAALVGGSVQGDVQCRIRGVGTLLGAQEGDISFLANPRYSQQLAETRASAVILRSAEAPACPVNALVVNDPYLTYARVAARLKEPAPTPTGIHETAVVAPSAQIDANAWVGPQCVVEADVVVGSRVHIGPGCYLGRGVALGEGSRLVAQVSVCDQSQIGRQALIHPGVVIGADGFGLAHDQDRWVKVPQLGRVVIGDDVEIGANTTIDRGALEDTVIEEGVKLDNQIQVAHNVHIGAHTAIAGCTGIAGSARIGRHCAIGGGVGIVGHIEITDGVQITGMSFVAHSIDEPGVYSSGTPLEKNKEWRRNYARFHQLNDMARRLRRLEKALEREQNDASEGAE